MRATTFVPVARRVDPEKSQAFIASSIGAAIDVCLVRSDGARFSIVVRCGVRRALAEQDQAISFAEAGPRKSDPPPEDIPKTRCASLAAGTHISSQGLLRRPLIKDKLLTNVLIYVTYQKSHSPRAPFARALSDDGAGRGARARNDAIRSRAALGHRSAGKRTGPHGAC